jgi:putative PIN family toxin of toxin-antitoxin system
MPMRVVVDTNILVSAMIKPRGHIGLILQHLRAGKYILIYSEPILTEIVDVLNRPRIRDKYGFAPGDIETFVALLILRGEVVVPKRRITVCRDPKDNMILEAAADGNADKIVSGDNDLLDLKNFEDIPTLKPTRFVAEIE